MLTELTHVSQRQGEPKRRWFQSPDEDLIVWYAQDGSILGFQLCYDIRRGERALTWLSGRGYSHERVDDGEVVGLGHKRTPVLVPDGAFAVDDGKWCAVGCAALVPSGESEDYCRMRVAYQSMPLEAFERFLDLAQSRGKNVNPPDGAGRFFLQLLEGNVSQREYGEALKRRLRDA